MSRWEITLVIRWAWRFQYYYSLRREFGRVGFEFGPIEMEIRW